MEYPFKDLLPLDEVLEREGYYRDWTHIDANTFHQISELVKFIRGKGYGADTREAIAQALERVYHDALKSGNANMEVSMARKHFKDLASRLDASDADLRNFNVDWINKNLGKLDGSYFSDDFIDELNNGTINVTRLLDKSVTMQHLSFTPVIGQVGKNLFNKDDAILNHHFSTTTGELLSGEGLYVSAIRNGSSGETYSLNPGTDSNDFFIVLFLNSDNQPVGFINTANDGKSFTLPEGATKFRFRGNMNFINGHQLEKGNQSTAYEPFKVFLEDMSIEDKSLSENKLSFQPLIIDDEYINLFDKSSVVEGAVNRTSGGIDANSSYVASDYIAVNSGDELVQTNVLTGAFYENGKFVSGIGFNQEDVIVPPNANQVRISVRKSEINTHMLIVGNKLPSDYVHHFNEAQKMAQERLFLSREIKSVPDYVRNVIFNTGSIIDLWGDSRTHGSGGTGFNTTPSGGGVQILGGTAGVYTSPNSHSWANSFRDLMADKYGVTVRNWGEHGRNTNHFVSRADTLLSQDINPDLIVMALATNDRHNMATVEQTKANYRIMIRKALDKGIKVVLLSMPPTSLAEEAKVEKNFSMYDIDKALRELAYEFEIGFISGYAKSLEYQENQDLPEDGLLADGLHENDLGHDVVYKGVVREMGISYVKSGSR